MLGMVLFLFGLMVLAACVVAAYTAGTNEEGTMELVNEPEGSFYRWEPLVK